MREPEDQQDRKSCPISGIESGGPIIGLGILLILFAVIPYSILPGSLPVMIAILLAGFGIFLIWIGIAK